MKAKKNIYQAGGKMPVKKMPVGGKMDMYGMGGNTDMYGMGGKMKKYLAGGQVKLDKNKDGKISGEDFKMMKKYQTGGTIGGQQTKQTRVEQGVNPLPSEYDMTTASGRKAYSDDRRAAQQNRIARKENQRDMTARERAADNQLMGKQAQASVTTGASPAKIVIGGGKGVQINPDLKAATGQRGSQTEGLRSKTGSATVLPRTRKPMKR